MKTWMWAAIAGVFAYLVGRQTMKAKTLYVSRGGTSYYETPEFAADQRASATVTEKMPPGPATLTAEQIYGPDFADQIPEVS